MQKHALTTGLCFTVDDKKLLVLKYFRLRAEELDAVKPLAQRRVDAEIAEAKKNGTKSAGEKTILRAAENQCICKHARISRWRTTLP